MKIENEHTFKNALGNGINLFLGSGFSILGRDSENRKLPTGSELAVELANAFEVVNSTQLTLGQLCTILESTDRESLYSFIRRRFTVQNFDPRYLELDKLDIRNIFTTNVDNLLYKVFASSKSHFLNDLDISGPAFNDRRAINIVTLHGCVLDEHRPMSFSNLDIASAFRADQDRWHSLTEAIQRHPTLFWGYSMSDSGTLEALSPRTVQGRQHKDKWIILSEDENQGAVQYFQAIGFQIIQADTSQMLDYIRELEVIFHSPNEDSPGVPTKTLFPQESIPEVGSVPVRPAIHFYLGEPPVWHDIFTGRLHRTSHYMSIRDSLNSGRHTIVIGLPACGKTTLMMQVAQEFSFVGHKLVCESPTLDKAKLIVNKLDGHKALMFIDNMADSADAFQYIIEQPNILVAGFERDHNFDIVSHIIDRDRCNIIDVTELSRFDVQEILSRVPNDIKASAFRIPQMSAGNPPSVFEIIESNITAPSLRTRFKSVIDTLAKQDRNLLDFLLACCYVHSCRTPVSMDMLIAFFRDEIGDYDEIYRMRERLGAMLAEYRLTDDEREAQDYWVPRSTILSEAVIEQAPGSALKRILIRFLRQVSPYRIHRFDIFRRNAYDAAFTNKAFPKWEEGREFYEEAYARDKSPYLLQQGALFLAHKKRFQEAFTWIDDANLQSGGRILSIRNSHAVILFRANIVRPPDDPTVRVTLQRSMDILSDCYNYDKRKTYHALTFADQALQYWDVYGDELADKFLATAKKWLREEQVKSPWNRNVKHLLNIITRKESN